MVETAIYSSTLFLAGVLAYAITSAANRIVEALDAIVVEVSGDEDDEEETWQVP